MGLNLPSATRVRSAVDYVPLGTVEVGGSGRAAVDAEECAEGAVDLADRRAERSGGVDLNEAEGAGRGRGGVNGEGVLMGGGRGRGVSLGGSKARAVGLANRRAAGGGGIDL